MFERFNIHTGLVFEYPTPNLSNIQLQTYIYWSLVGGYAGGYAPQRRVPRIHRITSSVHSYLRSISTAGVAGVGGVGGQDWPSLFILLISYVREIYALMPTTPVLGFQYSLELLFSNLHFYGPDGPDGPYAFLPSHESPSILTLFASPVYSYGGDATLHTFFMIRPFSLYSNKIETHSSLSYLLHQSCL